MVDLEAEIWQYRSEGGSVDSERFVFQEVTSLTAVAVGQPGRRTFYVVVGEEESWVRVWLEKEELLALSSAIGELVAIVSESGLHPPLDMTASAPEILFEPSSPPVADFKSNRLAVGYDQARDRIGLFIYEPEANNDSPTLVCWITRIQARTLGGKIDEVCAAGRPLCILCNGPIDPAGHVCPKSNGHGPREL